MTEPWILLRKLSNPSPTPIRPRLSTFGQYSRCSDTALIDTLCSLPIATWSIARFLTLGKSKYETPGIAIDACLISSEATYITRLGMHVQTLLESDINFPDKLPWMLPSFHLVNEDEGR